MVKIESVKKYTRIMLNIIIPLTAIYLVCFWGPKLVKFFLPFVIGWILSMIANPLVRFLEHRLKIVRKHGSILIVVSVLALVIGMLYLLVTRLIVESAAFSRELPELYAGMETEVRKALMKFEHLFLRLPENLQISLNRFSENLGDYIGLLVEKIATPTVTAAGNVAKGIPAAFVYSIITILSSYLFIVERDKILGFWKRYVPEGGTRYYRFLKKDMKHLIGGYFLAQFRIIFVVAVILAVGLLILGVKYSLLWAVLIAILDFLPLFGTGTALFPWAAVKLLSGDYAFAVGLILIYVLTQVVRQIIQPKIVGDAMGLPPLMTLLFLFLGFKCHGISGMILAVPIGMVGLNLYQFGAFDPMIDNLKLLIHDVDEFRKAGDK